MNIRLALVLVALFSVASTAPSSAAGDRYALVIGNSKYPDADAPLKEPINDARDVADELKRDGFNVDIGENLTGDAMRRAFDRLYGKIKPGSVALIFFSGFGVQSNRQSYMIPVDAQIWTEQDVRHDGFSLETVLGEINSRGAGVKIALIDASRRNPYERRFRTFSAGLAPVIAPNGTLVMYSAALSSVIGDKSLFVQELLKEIRVPDLMAEETLNRTRVGVTRASRGEQVPWISSSSQARREAARRHRPLRHCLLRLRRCRPLLLQPRLRRLRLRQHRRRPSPRRRRGSPTRRPPCHRHPRRRGLNFPPHSRP